MPDIAGEPMSDNNSIFTTPICSQGDHKIFRYSCIFEGINRILTTVVGAKTQEEIGNTCLSVALKTTGSLYGFVAELGTDGLLYNIAISDMGWEKCKMYDKTGQRCPLGAFFIRGLYSSVIKDMKSFYTNDSSSHPDSLGLPSGHPPLTSFLGVPLLEEGKLVGMIAVANREGGYTCEQLEDLEAIAPAVTQALKRKREEQKRKQAEIEVQKLMASVQKEKEMLSALIDNIPDEVWFVNTQKEIVLVNSAVIKEFGNKIFDHPKVETIVSSSEVYWPDGNPHPVEKAPFLLALKGEVIKDQELIIRTPASGELRHRQINAVPVKDVNGSIIGSVCVARDITESKQIEDVLKKAHDTLEEKVKERTIELEDAYNSLKESEEKYRNIVETANEGIIITDSKCIMSFVNNSLANMLDNTPENLINRSVWDIISDDYKHIVKMNLKMRKYGINNSYELKLIRKDYSFIWAFLNSKALLDKDDKYKGSMVMLTDITKRKEAEESLNAIEISRKKEIHHRIKNNLQVISSLLDLQVDKFKGKENIKDSEVIEAFRESQDRVISMALIHEELYKGNDTDTINISSYIKNLTHNLFLSYRRENIDVNLDIDIEENLFFDMDTSVPLGMIVNELVSNSFKHAFFGRENGEIWIKLHRENSAECENQEYSTVFTLVVSDNGTGFSEKLDLEDLDTLGMQLVLSLVDQLDGELDLKRNGGTEFVIKFAIKENNNNIDLRLFDND
jgi:PAS domain S-box-containing protein